MNVIIYLIFAGSLPPPLSVLQVNQYSRPRSESSPFIFRPSPSSFSYLPPRRVRYPASALSLSLSLSTSPSSLSLFLFPPLSSTLKVHRHYFRRNRRTSIRRVGETLLLERRETATIAENRRKATVDVNFISSLHSFSLAKKDIDVDEVIDFD